MCVESCFWKNNLFHPDLVVSKTKVGFCENIGTMELMQNIINEWDGKFIFDGDLIEGTKTNIFG